VSERFAIEDLERFVTDVVVACGGDDTQARAFAEVLVWSDAVGRATHGLWRLDAYVGRLERGLIRCPCRPTISRAAPGLIDIDGDNGFGQYVGRLAVDEAVEAARDTGIAMASVRASNHFGVGAYYVDRIAASGMLGLAVSNSVAKVAPHGGVRPVFGTNPLAIAIPRPASRPVVIDMATAAVSGASVIQAAERGETLPEGILAAADGSPLTDPTRADEGAMLPFGGAKGSGVALLVEVLASVVTGAASSLNVRSMFNDFTGPAEMGHAFIVIDVARLSGPAAYGERMEGLLREMGDAAAGDGLRLPGDARWAALEDSVAHGVDLDTGTRDRLRAIGERHSVAMPLPTTTG
jgi:LDH2 family malate/lactate/ureidoglycolate dehydrogenase